jgi:hypothetical protein
MHGGGAERCSATIGVLGQPFQRAALHESVGARPFRRGMHTSSFR